MKENVGDQADPLGGDISHFEWIFENSQVGIVLLDKDQVWIKANDAICEMVGKDREELIGNVHTSWVPEDSVEERERARAEFERTGSLRGKFKMYRTPEDVLYLDIQAKILPNGLRLVMATDITHHEKAKQELDNIKDRLEVALAAGDVATWIWDVRSDRVHADKNLTKWFNISAVDANGGRMEAYSAAIHPEDQARVSATIQDAITTGRSDYESEYRVTGSDGITRWVLARGSIERDPGGQAIRMPGVVLDITAAQRTAEALEESEDRFYTLFSAIDEGYCLCEILTDASGNAVDYRFLEINPLFEKITGFVNPVGKTALELNPDPEHVWLEIFRSVALEGKPKRFTQYSPIQAKWFNVFATPVRPYGRFALLFKDITTEHEREEARRVSEERKAAILRSAIDSIITMDHEGRIVDFNPAAERTFGHRSKDVVGKTVAEAIIPERLRAAHWSGFERYLRTGEQRVLNQLIELPAMRADGTEFPAELSINAIRTKDAPAFFTAFLRDITQRKQAEEALKLADKRKDEFIATMAHELRNPLAPIRTALEIIRSDGTDKDLTEEMTEMMDRQLGHLVHLIDDLLDVSRISQGKIELRRQIMDLNSVAYEAAEASKAFCSRSGTELSVDLPSGSIELLADRTRLIQVIGNLLNNACKFSGHGGKILLRIERSGAYAVITVKDNGIGLAADQLQTIFEMFSQVASPLARTHGGLGIGLSLVKRLTELHGGTVEAKSDGIGRGSEFLVRMPIIAPHADGHIADRSKDPGTEEKGKAQRRILIADDHRDTVVSLSAFLRLRGHEVYTAANGMEAVEIAEKEQPDVVILDIGMPVLNGYEAAEILSHRTSKRPVLLAITGWGQQVDLLRAEHAGFDRHMVKPVNPQLLIAWLEELPRRIENK